MRHPQLTLAVYASLLLAGFTIVLWVRSYRDVGPSDADSLNLTDSDPYWWIISNPGRLVFCHQAGKDWKSPVAIVQVLGLEYAGSWVGKSYLVNLLVHNDVGNVGGTLIAFAHPGGMLGMPDSHGRQASGS